MTADINAIIDQIEKAAEGATPGPWEIKPQPDARIFHVVGPSKIVHPHDGVCTPARINDRSFAEDRANMRFITSCNPQNVSALIKAYREMEARIAAATAVMDRCEHDGGFDREIGPIGCYLGDKCVCIGVYPQWLFGITCGLFHDM